MKPEYNDTNYNKCLCGSCSSCNDCCRSSSERAFCANKKCSCAIEKKSCLCGSCAVYSENDLSGGYFCVNGEAH